MASSAEGMVHDSAEAVREEVERNLVRYKNLTKLFFNSPEPEVGMTPKKIVWTKNKAKLYHYIPMAEKSIGVPILIIYALINRSYIVDLAPGNSLVEYLLKQGFDIYLLDWGTPGIEDRSLTFADYIYDYIPRAVEKVLEISKAEELGLFGYCMGGTMTAMYAALYPDDPYKYLTFLASPFDFADAGLYTRWLDKETFGVDKLVDVIGNVPGDFIDYGNKMLKPVTNFVTSHVNLWNRAWDEKFIEGWQVMNKWISDGTPFPGETFREWIKDFYQENKLVNKELKLRGQTVDLSNIRRPVLNIIAEKDHIAPIQQTECLKKYISSTDYKAIIVPGGHISAIVGKPAAKNLWPKLTKWLLKQSK